MRRRVKVLLVASVFVIILWPTLWILFVHPMIGPSTQQLPTTTTTTSKNPFVMTFYYNWYANISIDNEWFHWNQPILLQNGTIGEYFNPPNSIGSSFWPSLGLYSSNDNSIIAIQCDLMKKAGIDVIIISWYPEGTADQADDKVN